MAIVALYCVVAGNASWWRAVTAGRDVSAPATWLFVGASAVALTALHFVLLVLPATRWTVRAWLSALVLATASAAHLMGNYSVLLDASPVTQATQSTPTAKVASRKASEPALRARG